MNAPQISILSVTVLGLFAGPAVASLGGTGRSWAAFLDGASLSLVCGVCLLHLGPHALSSGGLLALGGGVIGAALPALLHRVGHGGVGVWSVVGFAALAVHAAYDGAALAVTDSTMGGSLTLALVAHRLTEGLAVHHHVKRRIVRRAAARNGAPGSTTGAATAWAVLAALALATVGGFAVGTSLAPTLPDAVEHVLEGLIAGALLSAVLWPDSHEHGAPGAGELEVVGVHHPRPPGPDWSALGAVVGLAIVVVFTAVVSATGALPHVTATARTLLWLSLESAPALLVGFVLSGLATAFVDPGGASGVTGLRRVGFGLDAALLSVPLLGVPIAIARVVAAFLLATLVALVVGPTAAEPATVPGDMPTLEPRGLSQRIREGLRHGLGEGVDHTLPWIVAGLLLAALAEPLLDHDVLVALPPVAQVPLAAVMGIPLYVSASGATPLAAMAVHKGVSVGAALAFLLSGPATSVTAFTMLSSRHGRTVAIRFGLVLLGLAVVAGYAVDALGLAMPALPLDGTEPLRVSVGSWLALAVLAAIALGSLFRQGPRGAVDQLVNPIHAH